MSGSVRACLLWTALLVCCAGQYQPANSFGAHQVYLYYSQLSESTSPLYVSFPFTLPFPYPTILDYSIALAGFKMQTHLSVGFRATCSKVGPVSFVIGFSPIAPTLVYYVVYYLVVRTSSLYMDFQTAAYNCTQINTPLRSVSREYFNQTSNFLFDPISDFLVRGYLIGYQLAANTTAPYLTISFDPITFFLATNVIQLSVYTPNVGSYLTSFTYFVIAIKLSGFVAAGAPYYFQTKINSMTGSVLTSASTWGQNYSIPSKFGPIFDKNCLLGLIEIELNAGVTGVREYSFNGTGVGFTSLKENFDSPYLAYTRIICVLECVSPVAFYDSTSNTCLFCNLTFPFCLTCDNYLNCLTCLDTFYVNSSGRCSSCNQMDPNCLRCVASPAPTCLSCRPAFYSSVEGKCLCITGSLVTNVCIDVFGCASASISQQMPICNSCKPGFTFSYGLCLCPYSIIGGNCLNLPGCLSALTAPTPICLACNAFANFVFTTLNGVCVCQPYYQMSGKECRPVCGDAMALPSEQCDDGNLRDGDGCSHLCLLEPNFQCSTANNFTICNLHSAIGLSLLDIKRSMMSNQATFTFSVEPPTSSLYLINLTNGARSLAVGSRIERVSYEDGVITMEISFTEDIARSQCSVLLELNAVYFKQRSLSCTFAIDSAGAALQATQLFLEYAVVVYFGYFLCGLTFLAFLLAMLNHKMIGVETLNTLQLLYYLHVLPSAYSFLSSSLSALGYLAGSTMQHTLPLTFSFNMQRLSLSENYAPNSIYVLPLTAALFLPFLICHFRCKPEDSKGKTVWLYQLFFNMTVGFFLSTLLWLHFQFGAKGTVADSFAAFFGLFFVSCVMSIELRSAFYKDAKIQLQGCPGTKYEYSFIYVCYLFLLSYLQTSLAQDAPLQLYCLSSIILLHLLYIVLRRPYFDNFHNISITINQSVLCLFACFALYVNLSGTFVSQRVEISLLFFLMVVLLACIILAFFRVYRVSKNTFIPTATIQEAKKKPQFEGATLEGLAKEKLNIYRFATIKEQQRMEQLNRINEARCMIEMRPIEIEVSAGVVSQIKLGKAVKTQEKAQESAELRSTKDRLKQSLQAARSKIN